MTGVLFKKVLMKIYPMLERILTVSITFIDVLKWSRDVSCVPAGLRLEVPDVARYIYRKMQTVPLALLQNGRLSSRESNHVHMNRMKIIDFSFKFTVFKCKYNIQKGLRMAKLSVYLSNRYSA
jgi:hypothetical protein